MKLFVLLSAATLFTIVARADDFSCHDPFTADADFKVTHVGNQWVIELNDGVKLEKMLESFGVKVELASVSKATAKIQVKEEDCKASTESKFALSCNSRNETMDVTGLGIVPVPFFNFESEYRTRVRAHGTTHWVEGYVSLFGIDGAITSGTYRQLFNAEDCR